LQEITAKINSSENSREKLKNFIKHRKNKAGSLTIQ
jgi:hypothetical protein